MKKTPAQAVKGALEAVVLYPHLPTLAHRVDYLGGVKAVAAALSAPKRRTRAKSPQAKGIGVRQIQLWLAHERQGQPGAPKQHKPIPQERAREIVGLVNEKAFQQTILRIRTHGLLASLEGSLIISDKPFWRAIGIPDPILITHLERDGLNRSLLTLFCDAAAQHKWAAAADLFFEAFFMAYNFQEAHPDVDLLSGQWEYDTLMFGIPDDELAGQAAKQ